MGEMVEVVGEGSEVAGEWGILSAQERGCRAW